MNKNYYDILQINQNASPEIIEKAYKTLAKKYHPDLQEESNKKEAEEILKEINEAYEILSDPNKKALYDQNLKNETISQEEYNEIYEENQNLKNTINNMQHSRYSNSKSTSVNNINNNNNINSNNYDKYNNQYNNQNNNPDFEEMQRAQELEYQKQQLEYQQQMEQARQKAYHDAYIQDLKNRGYRIKYKKSLKDYIKGIISILIVIAILIILWHVPFIHNFFVRLYEGNEILKYSIDTITSLFKK